MSEKSLKELKAKIRVAFESQKSATDQSTAYEGIAKHLSSAVSAYVIDELKTTGVVFEGEELPEVVNRKGNLEGIATTALTAISASEAGYAENAGHAIYAVAASAASSSINSTYALTASYVNLVAGLNISINTASNGSITIADSAAYWVSNVAGNIFTTGSIDVTGSMTQGSGTLASGIYSHAEGWLTTASAPYSHAEGYGSSITINTATGSHAEGYQTVASSLASHSEGRGTAANGQYSHAEGYGTISDAFSSHAEGSGSFASGPYSHAEGWLSLASGTGSHSEGFKTTGSGDYSHA